METRELAGKAAVVTGASRGIGAAAAVAFAEAGVDVVLAARSKDALNEVAAAVRAAGARAETVVCDVTDYAAVEAVVTLCRERFGRLDILVNNAGVIDPVAHLSASDPEAWSHVIDVNVKGVYYGMRAAAPVMEAAGSGVIVNISSGAAVSAMEGWSHYCSSKAAVLSLTRCGEKELAPKGVRVIGLSPGTVATDMQRAIKSSGVNPVSQLAWDAHIPAEWAGKAVAWLATQDAAEFDGTDVSLRQEDIRRRVGLLSEA
ncbi:MAG: SDR family oxidoreductase [Pseudomonadota bacterium]